MVDRVYFIRHGESEGNLYRRLHGSYDSKLTENGLKQAEALGRRLANEQLGVIFSSDLSRAVRTAEAVLAAQSEPPENAEIIKLPALRELGMGSLEDRTWGELTRSHRGVYEDFSKAADFHAYGGESLADVYLRAGDAVKRLVSEYDGNMTIVAHAFVTRACISALTGTDVFSCPTPHNASVTILEREGDGDTFRISLDDDYTHTAGLETPRAISPEPFEYLDPHLWFRTASGESDVNIAVTFWEDAWQAVYGHISGFDRFVASSEIRRMLEKDRESVRIAMLGENKAGILVFDTFSRYDPDCGHISLIAVREELRGRAFALQLLGEAVSRYRSLGRAYLRLRVSVKNDRALKFYRRNGFSVCGTEYDSDGEQFIMKKDI